MLFRSRWLIPLAQSPTTNELAGYFEVAEQIAETLSEEDRIEIQKAGVRMAGGHLRSQLRHVSTEKGVSLNENSLVLSTRKSNALDFALLIQGLVPLLDAYERARHSGDGQKRLELANAICQGISPDPELFESRRVIRCLQHDRASLYHDGSRWARCLYAHGTATRSAAPRVRSTDRALVDAVV